MHVREYGIEGEHRTHSSVLPVITAVSLLTGSWELLHEGWGPTGRLSCVGATDYHRRALPTLSKVLGPSLTTGRWDIGLPGQITRHVFQLTSLDHQL